MIVVGCASIVQSKHNKNLLGKYEDLVLILFRMGKSFVRMGMNIKVESCLYKGNKKIF